MSSYRQEGGVIIFKKIATTFTIFRIVRLTFKVKVKVNQG